LGKITYLYTKGKKDYMGYEKFKNIITGWKNLVFKNPVIEEIAISRIVICSECPEAKSGIWKEAVEGSSEKKEKKGIICSACKCPIQAKTRVPLESCPKGKWERKRMPLPDQMKLNDYLNHFSKVMEMMSVINHATQRFCLGIYAEKMQKEFIGLAYAYENMKNDLFNIETNRSSPTPFIQNDVRYHKRSTEYYLKNTQNPDSIMLECLTLAHVQAEEVIRISNVSNVIFANRGTQQIERLTTGPNDMLLQIEEIIKILKDIAILNVE
jgi:hypothetical protein